MEPAIGPGVGGTGGVGDLADQVAARASRSNAPPLQEHVDRGAATGKNPASVATRLPAGPSAQAAVKATSAAVAASSAPGASSDAKVKQLQEERDGALSEIAKLQDALGALKLDGPQLKLAKLQREYATKQNDFVRAQDTNTDVPAKQAALIAVESEIRSTKAKMPKEDPEKIKGAVGLLDKIDVLSGTVRALDAEIKKLNDTPAPEQKSGIHKFGAAAKGLLTKGAASISRAATTLVGGSSPKSAVEKESQSKMSGETTSLAAASRALANVDEIEIPSFNLTPVDENLKFASPKEALAALRAASMEGADKPKAALNSYLNAFGFREDPLPRSYSDTPIASDKIADAKFNKAIIDGLLDPKAKRFEKALNKWTDEAWNKLDILIGKANEILKDNEQTPDGIELRKELEMLQKARDIDHGLDTGDTKGSRLDITPKGLIMGRLRRMENMYNTAFEISNLSK